MCYMLLHAFLVYSRKLQEQWLDLNQHSAKELRRTSVHKLWSFIPLSISVHLSCCQFPPEESLVNPVGPFTHSWAAPVIHESRREWCCPPIPLPCSFLWSAKGGELRRQQRKKIHQKMETNCGSSVQQEVLLSPLLFREGLETDRRQSQAAPKPRGLLSLHVIVLEAPTSCPDPQQAVVILDSISTCEHLAAQDMATSCKLP